MFCIFFDKDHFDWCEVKFYCSLIGISLIISGVDHLSCAPWLSVCLLWRNVFLRLLCIFVFFNIELYELYVNFGD